MLTPSRQLTDAEKLRKVILELVDTERAYVKVIIPSGLFILDDLYSVRVAGLNCGFSSN